MVSGAGSRLQVTTIQHIETEVSPANTLKSLFTLQMVNWTIIILGVFWILSLLNFLWNSALRIFMQIAITTHHVSRIMVQLTSRKLKNKFSNKMVGTAEPHAAKWTALWWPMVAFGQPTAAWAAAAVSFSATVDRHEVALVNIAHLPHSST